MGAVDEPADRRKFTGTSDRFSARAIDARGVSDDVVKPTLDRRRRSRRASNQRRTPHVSSDGRARDVSVDHGASAPRSRRGPSAAPRGRRGEASFIYIQRGIHRAPAPSHASPIPPLHSPTQAASARATPVRGLSAKRRVASTARLARPAARGRVTTARAAAGQPVKINAVRGDARRPGRRRRKPPPRRAPSRPRPLTIPTPDARRSSRASKATPPRSPPPTSRRSSSRSGSCIWCASDRDDAPVRAPDSATGPRGSSRLEQNARDCLAACFSSSFAPETRPRPRSPPFLHPSRSVRTRA